MEPVRYSVKGRDKIMDYIDITPYVKPRNVFNFNFSTILLFRCTKRKYAESFVKGKIFFNQPKNWIQIEKDGNKGQGDVLEGTFLSAKENDNSNFIKKLKKDSNLTHFYENGFVYFRRKKIEELYSICFHGLKDNSFTQKNIEKDGKAHYISRVENSYFTDFSNNITELDYESIEDNEKPVVMFINNPHKLFERVRDALKKIGLSEDEIIISPVEYIDKKVVSISAIPYPKELLLKDNYYSQQSEIRIIINSSNDKFMKYMKDNNNTIDIGNIEDITEIYDYYFQDLLIEKTGKNSIIFTLPKPMLESFEEMNLERLLNIIVQVSSNTIPQKMGNDEKEELLTHIKKCIKDKYNIDVEYNNGKIEIYNANEEIFKYLENLEKPYKKVLYFENRINSLILEGKYKEALKEVDNELDDDELNRIGIYYIGKILEIQKKYFEAIEKYTYCINNEIKECDSLSSRSNCYCRIGKYNLALKDLEVLQDKIGYNSQIYANKGINYVFLNKLNDAIKEFDKSISMEENNPFAYYNRSVAYYRLSNFKQAKADIEKALKYDSRNEKYNEEYNRFYKNIS